MVSRQRSRRPRCPRATGATMLSKLKQKAGFTKAEAAVYDRQLRVWGVEAQQR